MPQIESIRASAREHLVRDLVDAGLRVQAVPGKSPLYEKYRCSFRNAAIPLWLSRDVKSPDHLLVIVGDAPFWSWLRRRADYAALFAELDRFLDAHVQSSASNS